MTDTKLTKRGPSLKALDDAGHGLARIATLSAVDSDGDTYAPGAFGDQWGQILGAHNWQSVPLGKARVFERGDEALAELHLNLETEAGRDWHAALKFDLDGCCEGSPPVQEWSYGFRILDSQQETRDGQRIRVLKRLSVHEVSPVVLGAGVGTATLAMKGLAFVDQLDAVLDAAEDLAGRAGEISELRAADGRRLGKDRIDRLTRLKTAIEAVLAADAAPAIEARRLLAEHERLLVRRHLPSDI